MSMDLPHLLLSLAVGFVIGYLHTGVAIVMLFRPHRELRLLGLRFQGMIPRRKAEIARSVARIVSSDLLKGERVAQRIAGEEVRSAFEGLALDLARRYLTREYGPLRQILGDKASASVERALEGTLVEAARAAGRWTETVQGQSAVTSVIEALLDRSLAELVPGEEPEARRLLTEKGLGALASPELEERLCRGFRVLVDRLRASERPLAEVLPSEVQAALRRTVTECIPAVLRRFDGALLSPQNVERIKAAVRSGIRAYLMETGGGVVRNVVRQVAILGRERIFRETDEIVGANVHRLRELVYEEENRAHVEAGLLEALEAFLQRSPRELLASVDPATREELCAAAAKWACGQLRRPEAAQALSSVFEREIRRAFHSPLREALRLSGGDGGSPGRWARALGDWAGEGGLARVAAAGEPAAIRALLDTPLGQPSRLLADGLVREVVSVAVGRVMPAVAAEVPEILRIVDIEGLIEREVLHLEPADVERVIVSVARRELGAIAWWGGVLGALVVAAQVLIQGVSLPKLF